MNAITNTGVNIKSGLILKKFSKLENLKNLNLIDFELHEKTNLLTCVSTFAIDKKGTKRGETSKILSISQKSLLYKKKF